ncbi:DEAD/DEAH box helicase [Paenibacillus sp. D2_2]|uniref:DEAD/DEAH box helicase n=1 Tax=Paenibacillus sp. D2_2 TaxID=3073092 RepID=UPI0028169C0C|nr:DEAD/DEAH box helicase [Paenibacillus sp. D2_2]WMT38868.1 DEAD/DEAH box helicase [Paenibacillus sp. D2_2]
MRDIMGLFGMSKPRLTRTGSYFDARERIEAEFILRLDSYGYEKQIFSIEMKLGTKRLYIVKNIKQFLEQVDLGGKYTFTPNFTYDPQFHSFPAELSAIVQKLIDIHRNEHLIRETADHYNIRSGYPEERSLVIPPYAWAELLALLRSSPSVKLEANGVLYKGFFESSRPLPIQYAIRHSDEDDSYSFEVEGLDEITILDSYNMALIYNELITLDPQQCLQLHELKKLLKVYRKAKVGVGTEQMALFIEKALPGLMKLGEVKIDDSITDRIVRKPLQARLYLDRLKNRLLAGLEFQYGDVVINPLEDKDLQRGSDHILIRDEDQEQQILELMDDSSFVRTESGFFLEDETAEFDFLYHIVPRLEQFVNIFATTAVKVRIERPSTPPRISAIWDERTDWLEFKFELNGVAEKEVRELIEAIQVKRKYYKLPNGSLMPLSDEKFKKMIQFVQDSGKLQFNENGDGIRVPLASSFHLLDEQRYTELLKPEKSLRRLLSNLKNPDNMEFVLPTSLAPVLRDYQVYGYQWLKTLAMYHFGGILADDMGLGKTLQSITFLVSVLPEIREHKLPAIIVAPASLVYNWRNELRKFAPEIRSLIVDGSKSERVRQLQEQDGFDIIITSYPLLRRDIEQYTEQAYHTLILDEAQNFKNHTTQTAHAVKALQAKYKFALTGTPIENSLEELWSIFDAVFPALFRDRQTFNDLSRENIANRIKPFLLRRLKTDVLSELPEKIESVQTSELLSDQKNLYAAYLAQLQQETLKHLNEDSFQQNKIRILAGLTRLRQLCCHPSLFIEDYKGRSAKFDQLFDIIDECLSSGKRMLIFSQFTQMLNLIGRELGYSGIPYFYLDGTTPSSERIDLCDRFNEGEHDIFLISLKAGGTGLNLTGADTVILYDLWWNPAVEQQAADRAHRIGQTKVVQIIRLLTEGTVEEKMYELQQKKKDLIDEIIQPGQQSISSMTEQEIREILMI